MIVSVTVLGSNGDVSLAEVGKRIADYLEGGRQLAPGALAPGNVNAGAGSIAGSIDGAAAYYADSAGPRPGRWVLDRSGEVDAGELATLLAGMNPTTREPLISASGSAGRALRQRGEPITRADLGRDWYYVSEAAEVLGISAAYLRKILQREEFEGCDTSAITVDHRRRKLLSKDLVASIAENRKPPRVVAGYDLTFSPVKSVSVLWAGGDEATREAILDALDESVGAGLRYLEHNAFAVRTKGQTEPASEIIAADYLHTTSRALEPQLHHHVVIANVGTGMDGVPRALDARQIFHHAKTSSYLAAAELRHQLTTRLGVRWTKVENGLAEIEGIPEAAIAEMSSRSKEIAAKTTELGVNSAKARQVAAWSTRAAKQHGVDEAKLVVSWNKRLTAAGFGPKEREAVLGRVEEPESWSLTEKERLFTQLLRVDGLTEHTAVFDRRHVIKCLADCVGDRLPGDLIDELADELLARPEVVELESTGEGNKISETLIQRGDGQTVSMSSHRLYTTEAMLTLEQRALTAYERGRANSLTSVAPELIDAVLDRAEFAHLSFEQRDFVTSLTGSTLRIQAGVGAAGSGKTTALKAAVAIWREAGYQVIGAAVGGTQAVVLSEETGIETRTVASVLARYFDHGDVPSVNAHTVLLVDEASLLSTKDFVALTRIAGERDALLRVIGDPAQHSVSRQVIPLFWHFPVT